MMTKDELQRQDNWRATFRRFTAFSYHEDRLVMLMKSPGVGFHWETPGVEGKVPCDLNRLRDALEDGRLVLVKGKIPNGVIANKKKKAKCV